MKKHNTTYRPLVSIVIPSYLRYDLLQRCLDAIPAAFSTVSFEVLIVENGSPLEERTAFYRSAKLPEHTQVVVNNRNVGFAQACDQGFKRSVGAVLFFLNNDVILDPGAGDTLLKTLDDPSIGVVGMRLRFPSASELDQAGLQHSPTLRAPERVQHCGLAINLRGQVFHLYTGWEINNPRTFAPREVFAVTGAAFLIRRKLYIETGGFDPIYGAGAFEDVDLCMKVAELGKKIVVEQCATGKHYTGATAEKYQRGFPLGPNQMTFNQKWYNKIVWDEYKYW